MSTIETTMLPGADESFDRHFTMRSSTMVVERLANLSDEDRADYRELEDEYRTGEDEDEKREIVRTMVEILLNEPPEGISIEEIEREAQSSLEGAAAAEGFEREAGGFGQNLRRVRGEKGLNQKELAAASNMTQPQISYLERGKHRPQEATVNKLAEALGVSPEELLPLD